jgi:lipid-binding SYLF domain-containing protein
MLAGSFLLLGNFPLLAQNDEEQADIARCKETIGDFLEADEGLQSFFSDSYGFAIFPAVGKGAVGIGGAHGNGILFKGGQPYGTTEMTQVSIGFQWGGQSYMEVIFMEDKGAFDDFAEGKTKLAAQASAVAATAGASADAGYNEGVAIFTFVKGGLMYEASVGGQKFKYREFKDK